MPDIWILSNFTQSNNYTNSALLNAVNKHDIQARFIDYSKIKVSTNDSDLFYDGNILSPPDLVILSNSIPQYNLVSIPSSPGVKGVLHKLIAARMEKWTNTCFINSLRSHLLYSSKHNVYSTLTDVNIPFPITISTSPLDPKESFKARVIQEVEFPCVLKPSGGWSGRGVTLCNNEAEFDVAFDQLLATNPYDYVVAQKYLPEADGLTYTVRVIGDQIYPGVILGSPYVDPFKAENSVGRKHMATRNNQQLNELCADVMRVLELGSARLDIFYDDEHGFRVCEVNVSGEYNRTDCMLNIDQATIIVDYSLQKLKDKTSNA
jgi:glutathione synthase/RimK-type ligase-like ATP-grasp enzyme